MDGLSLFTSLALAAEAPQLQPAANPLDSARDDRALPTLTDETEDLLQSVFQDGRDKAKIAGTTHTAGGTRRTLHGTSIASDFQPLKSMGAAANTTQEKDEFAYGAQTLDHMHRCYTDAQTLDRTHRLSTLTPRSQPAPACRHHAVVSRVHHRPGELPRGEFMRIFEAVGAKPGESYYDLGAGEGKSVAVRHSRNATLSGRIFALQYLTASRCFPPRGSWPGRWAFRRRASN